jgi:hypothetical protein
MDRKRESGDDTPRFPLFLHFSSVKDRVKGISTLGEGDGRWQSPLPIPPLLRIGWFIGCLQFSAMYRETG